MSVRTRMAPSPTGEMHVGSMATLLKNYAFAKKNGGQFLLRIEDTDQEREVPGAIDRIISVIKAYGLDYDEGPHKEGEYGPYVQSKRLEIYQEHAKQLVASGKAYYCFCSKERLEQVREAQMAAKQAPRYDRHCVNLDQAEAQKRVAAGESAVIRLRVPEDQEVKFNDWIRGEIIFNSREVDDQVLLKSDGFPTYHLAVVIDDYLMKITHIMRGEEWISSTPKHLLLYQAFGWEAPIYAHIPLFLNPDGKGKMSKRKGDVSAQSFLDKGYLPEAMLNFFMILGWTPKDQREILTLTEYIEEFHPQDISHKAVAFDIQKLNWLNGVYLRNLDRDTLISRLEPFIPADAPRENLQAMLDLVFERLVVLSDFEELTAFFYRPITVDRELLIKKSTPEEVAEELRLTQETLLALTDWTAESLETAIRQLQEQQNWKKGQYFMMIRVAVTGRMATPPLFETMTLIGRDEVMNRLALSLQSVA